MRDAAREIGGAVDGIDHPDRRLALGDAAAAFLADEAVVREKRVQPFGDQPLDLLIYLGEKVLRPLQPDLEAAIAKPPLSQPPRLLRERRRGREAKLNFTCIQHIDDFRSEMTVGAAYEF